MQFDTLLIDSLTSELRIARVQDGILQDLEVHRPGAGRRAGDILLGRVKAVVPGIRGAFVDIGDERDGFLAFPEKSGKSPVTEGQSVIVQVRSEAMAEKGARLATKVNLSGFYVVFMPGQPGVHVSRQAKSKDKELSAKLSAIVTRIIRPGDGAIIRTAALDAGDQACALVEQEITSLCDQWIDAEALKSQRNAPAELCPGPDPVFAALGEYHQSGLRRIVIDGAGAFARIRTHIQATLPSLEAALERHTGTLPLFEAEGLEEQIDQALVPHVDLPSGGSLAIVVTPACITVDVDSSTASSKGNRGEVINNTNMEACQALLYQLQLRNLAGHIVIDFISSKDRSAGKTLLKQLEEQGSDQSVPFEVAGFTRLGLVECLRRRRSLSLADILCGHSNKTVRSPLSVAYDVLRALYGEGRANPGRTLAIKASTAVYGLLNNGMSDDLKTVQGDLGVDVTISISENGNDHTEFEIYTQ